MIENVLKSMGLLFFLISSNITFGEASFDAQLSVC